jgi:hypothetical protein
MIYYHHVNFLIIVNFDLRLSGFNLGFTLVAGVK